MTNQSFERFEARKKSLESNGTVHSLERWSSPHTHPGGSLLRLAAQKFRVLTLFAIRRLVSSQGRAAALAALSTLSGSASGKEVLVIASGPSANTLNATAVAKAQKAGSLIVVATNYFLSSPLATTISPDYLLWSDSVFHPKNRKTNPSWDLLADNPTTKVVSPWTWKHRVPGEFASRMVYFDDDTLETWSRNISPLKPRGYQGTTGAKALALGIHLEPSTTYVIGLDLSYFRHFSVDAENRVWRHPAHVAGTDSGNQDLTHNTVSGIADSLYSTANQFYYLRALFSGYPVVNLDPGSLVDAFPKVTSHPLVKKTRSRSSASKK
jgi:hypothetical protein